MESDSTGWRGLLTLASGSLHMPAHDWLLVLGLLLALVVAATSAAAETALTSVSRIKIRNLAEEGDAKAKRIEHLLQQPQLFLSTILLVSNVCVISASTLATIVALDLNFTAAEVVSTILLSLIVLVFCDIAPKSAAVQSPERWSRWLVGPVESAMVVLLPLVRTLTWITARIFRVFGGQVTRRGPFVTEDELRLLVEVGQEEGVLEGEERAMIDNVFDLADTAVREVMVPRIDMVTIAADSSLEDAAGLMLQGGQSRIPVYDGSIDNIIGVLYAKDLLRIFATQEHPPSVRALVRTAYFVPESKRLDDLLRELQERRIHMAIVMDEYGQVAGLVTIEDLVEEIIGDIQDEYDTEEQQFERVGENEFIVDARMGLDDFAEVVGRSLPEDGYDTVGGFVYSQLDKIPSIGDTIHYEDMAITVLNAKGRRVTKIKVLRGVRENGDEEHGASNGIEAARAGGPAPQLPPGGAGPPAKPSAPSAKPQG